ncbi:MAG: hypothetical protein U0670_11985 [Anaerolineae bacterium]
MWDKFRPLLPEFPTAILNALDVDGQPFSVRCIPLADEPANAFHLSPLPVGLQSGPASLLFHKQGAHINQLKSFLLRGTLSLDDHSWTFTPSAFVPGVGVGSLLDQIRFLREGKRAARQYLAKRGIAYPKIDWKAIEDAEANAKQP